MINTCTREITQEEISQRMLDAKRTEEKAGLPKHLLPLQGSSAAWERQMPGGHGRGPHTMRWQGSAAL